MFHTIFYQPIFNSLIGLYNLVGDIGIAIIILTVLLKLVLWPLTQKSLHSQKMLQTLQPKLKALQEKHKDDKQALTAATMQLYKEEKVNPFSSCLPLLIQLPFLFALYQVLVDGLNSKSFDSLYGFVQNPGTINVMSLGFLNLAVASIPLAIIAGGAQFWQAKMMSTKRPEVSGAGAKDESRMAAMNKQMLYFMPALTVIIGLSFPGGLALYWLVTTVLTALQQLYLFKRKEQVAQ